MCDRSQMANLPPSARRGAVARCVMVAIALVVVVAGCGASRPAAPGDARRAERTTVVTRCAPEAPRSVHSLRPGSATRLVPGRPAGVLLCRYGGLPEPGVRTPGFGLLGSRRLDAAGARSLAAQLDALRPNPAGAAYSCPSDTGTSVLAVFSYASGVPDTVTIGLQGCRSVTNGPAWRNALDAPVVGRLSRLTPSRAALQHESEATIEGRVAACGGAAIGPRCRPAGKSFHLVVRVLGPGGDWTDLAGIGRSARFRVLVVPGHSRVELIQDWWDGHPHILATRFVAVRAGRVARIALTLELK